MSNVAFLWDESFLWGLMAYKTLKGLGLGFDLVRSEDIKKGCLKDYRMLFVPGGWASNKLKALGDKGAEEIKRFVYEGGNYFGICGGAGLATMDGLGLLNIRRKPTRERVPSFSGRIYLNINKHPIWNLKMSRITHYSSRIFHAWWPSQFVVNDKDIDILATFGDALPDAYSSDLNVGDVRKNGDWRGLEELYGINLDPERLKDEPAVVEGRCGKGKVLLSLIHFDTPGDENGAEVLKNIWEYLGGQNRAEERKSRRAEGKDRAVEQESSRAAVNMEKLFFNKDYCSTALLRCCSEIIDFGIRNFLWFWRTPMILQWRRGVRGLEYNTLYVMAKEIVELEQQNHNQLSVISDTLVMRDALCVMSDELTRHASPVTHHGSRITHHGLLNSCSTFKEKALRLLMLERKAMQQGMITYEYSDNPEIQTLRKELFGNSKSYGGRFKELLDQIDYILYQKLVKEV